MREQDKAKRARAVNATGGEECVMYRAYVLGEPAAERSVMTALLRLCPRGNVLGQEHRQNAVERA